MIVSATTPVAETLILWTRSRGTIQALIISGRMSPNRWKKCSRDLYSRYSVNFIDFWSFTQWVQIFLLPRISRWSPTVRVRIVPVNPLQMWSTESLSGWKLIWFHQTSRYGGFLKWWYPTTMGFPTKNDHFVVFWGYHHLRKHPYDDEPSCTKTQSQFVFFPMWASCPLPTLICQPHVVIYWLLLICLMCESNLTLSFSEP